MVARRVYMRLKPDSVVEFTQKLETEIISLLPKQNGFQVTLRTPPSTKLHPCSSFEFEQSQS